MVNNNSSNVSNNLNNNPDNSGSSNNHPSGCGCLSAIGVGILAGFAALYVGYNINSLYFEEQPKKSKLEKTVKETSRAIAAPTPTPNNRRQRASTNKGDTAPLPRAGGVCFDSGSAQTEAEPQSKYITLRRTGFNLSAPFERGEFFDKLEDVIYRIAHYDTRAIRDHEQLHMPLMVSYFPNGDNHIGKRQRKASREDIRDLVAVFEPREQEKLAGVLERGGYCIDGTIDLMTAVNDLYTTFHENIRRHKRRKTAMWRDRAISTALLIKGIKMRSNGGKYTPGPSGVHGGHIRGGHRVY